MESRAVAGRRVGGATGKSPASLERLWFDTLAPFWATFLDLHAGL